MIRFVRGSIIFAALLVILLEFFGLRDFLRSPYIGIKSHNLKISNIEDGEINEDSSLKIGDIIVAVNGVKVTNINHYKYLISKNKYNAPITFTVQRNGKLFKAEVKVGEQPFWRKQKRFGLIISGLTFILVGFIVVVKRLDIMGILFSVNCLLIAFILTDRPAVSPDILHIGGELIYDMLFIFFPAFFLHFFLVFPGREIKKGTLRFRMEKYLYYPPAVIFTISFILALANYNYNVSRSVIHLNETVASIYWVFYIILSPVVFIRTFRTSHKALRTKFRIVTFGLAIGILPMAIMMLVMQIKPTGISNHYLNLSWISLSFISIAFGYAILKHDAFNSRLVLRSVVVYLIFPLLFTILFYTITEISNGKFSELLDVNNQYISLLAIIFFAILFVPARSFVFNIFERHFYRKRSIIKSSLIEFSHNICLHKTKEKIIVCVADEIVSIFKPESVQVFLPEENDNFEIKHVLPSDKEVLVKTFPRNIELIHHAEKKRHPLMLEYFDTLWVNNNLDEISRKLVKFNKGSAIMVLSADNITNGFIVVGPKTSGGIYTGEDAELLNFLGERTADSLRNIEFYRIHQEKKELDKDLSKASGIQKRLLPEHPPTLKGAEVAAKIRTCKKVGGDFYDFHELGSGITGLAISDIAGHGVSAAFLMSAIQASLKAESSLERKCSDIVYALNNHLFEKSDRIMHATLFYCLYDENTGILHYSNAGAVPPVLLKQNGKVISLKRGGMVIGVKKDVSYLEGAVKLESGDIMMAFTDGVLDQEDDEGNHFGSDRLIKFIRGNYHLSLNDLLDKLFSTLEDYGNSKMKDDMTAIVLKKE